MEGGAATLHSPAVRPVRQLSTGHATGHAGFDSKLVSFPGLPMRPVLQMGEEVGPRGGAKAPYVSRLRPMANVVWGPRANLFEANVYVRGAGSSFVSKIPESLASELHFLRGRRLQ